MSIKILQPIGHWTKIFLFRCSNCHGWPVTVGAPHETLTCSNCDDIIEEEDIDKYHKVKTDFLAAEDLDYKSAYRHLCSMFSVCHPYDLSFIAACQITLMKSIEADEVTVSYDIAALLWNVMKHLVPNSKSVNELKRIVQYLKEEMAKTK